MIMAAYFLVLYGGVGFIQFSEQLAENFFSFLLLILGQRIVLLVNAFFLISFRHSSPGKKSLPSVFSVMVPPPFKL